jgi:hypothetical protein
MRSQAGALADVYFYRACAFAKLYAPAGSMETAWDDLAVWINWPDTPDDLRRMFRQSGAVSGPRDLLYLWDETNGWLIRKYARDAQRQANKRKAGKASARARRTRRANPGLGGRSVGRGERVSADGPRTVRGRKS